MFTTATVFGAVMPPTIDPEPAKGPKTSPVRIKVRTAAMFSDIAEAKGVPVWRVVEDMVAAVLPAEHKAVQPQLRKVRELGAKMAEVQEQARKDRAG
jgi:hypothetical protein